MLTWSGPYPVASCRPRTAPRNRKTIAPTIERLDRRDPTQRIELATQPADELRDDVALVLDLFPVHMLGQLGCGKHASRPQHELLQHPILARRELHWHAIDAQS